MHNGRLDQAKASERGRKCNNYYSHFQLYPFKIHVKHPSDYVRQFPHLRARTKKFSSVLRVRNTASIAVHEYFQVIMTNFICDHI